MDKANVTKVDMANMKEDTANKKVHTASVKEDTVSNKVDMANMKKVEKTNVKKAVDTANMNGEL